MLLATLVLLGSLGCGSRTGIKKAGADASTEVASPTGTPTGDTGGPVPEVDGSNVAPDTAAMAFPDTGTDRPFDQALPSGDTGTDRPLDQTVQSDGGPDVPTIRADGRAEPNNTPNGHFELRDDSPWPPAPEAGQCSPGFIRAYGFDFPMDAQTVKVRPVSAIKSFDMDGTLSDSSGPVLRYDLNNPAGQLAGELLVWRQDNTWFAQVTVYGTREDSGCARGELVFKGTL